MAFDGPIPPDRSYTLGGKFLSKFPGKEIVIKTNLTIEDAEFNSTTRAVPVTVNDCPNNAPWGMQDTIEWSRRDSYGDPHRNLRYNSLRVPEYL